MRNEFMKSDIPFISTENMSNAVFNTVTPIIEDDIFIDKIDVLDSALERAYKRLCVLIIR
ncbi:MAG: hypothetical protein LBU55_05355 [Elusimicrobiota bacterium]|jgi:hypothetical protein|nr:hypothetical protein [Elusimicrobiota bacterium]